MPRFLLLVTRIPTPPSRGARHPPPPESTHANFVCAGPGVGRWALACSRHGDMLPTIWAMDNRPPRRRGVSINTKKRVIPWLDHGIQVIDVCGRMPAVLFYSLDRHAPLAMTKGSKYPNTHHSCHSRARGPRKYECICGVDKAEIGSIKFISRITDKSKNTQR